MRSATNQKAYSEERDAPARQDDSRVTTASGCCVLPRVFEIREIVAMRSAINETIDRVAMALRAPFPASFPNTPLDERLERVAAHDRSYAHALFRAVLADAHRDPRIEAVVRHRVLSRELQRLAAPLIPCGHIIRMRGLSPSLAASERPWAQDAATLEGRAEPVRFTCWIPLRDLDMTTGAIEALPGRWDRELPHARDSRGRIRLAQVPECERRVLSARRGDVIVLDRLLPYRILPVAPGASTWMIVMTLRTGETTQPAATSKRTSSHASRL